MKRAIVLGAAIAVAGTVAAATPAVAQATLGADLGIFSSYVWRGLYLTNRPVAQPDLYVTIPAGNASVTLGGWANIDLGKYDDPQDHISESGGTSSFNFAEFDPWAEISFPAGKATLTGGATAYIFPNKAGLTSDINTLEFYGKAAFDVPLSPKLALFYDVVSVKGAYLEGSISHPVPLSENVSLSLGALGGVNVGMGVPDDINSDESANFAKSGFTHLDLSAGVPFTTGSLSITPAVHFVVNGDDFTKVSSPTDESDFKVWLGGTISWSKPLGAVPPEEGEAAAPGQ